MDGSWDHPETIGEPGAELASDATLRRAFELADMPVPTEIMEMVRREEGGLTVYACSTSMKLLDLPAAEVSKRVDHVAGLATMLETAEGAQILYI
jgi:peroxiredoxin family protein